MDSGGGCVLAECRQPIRRRSVDLHDDPDGGVDRISGLPEPIMHHIMSSLPTEDATHVSILSHNCRNLWKSYPILDFDQRLVEKASGTSSKKETEEFLDYLSKSIRCHSLNSALQKIRLHVNLRCFTKPRTGGLRKSQNYKRLPADDRIDSAINFALENSVKELDLSIGSEDMNGSVVPYSLPETFFSGKLHFNRNLILRRCDDPKCIKLSGAKLKMVEVDQCSDVERLEINAPNFQSFSYNGLRDSGEIELIGCEYLKNLSLKNAIITDKWVKDNVSTFLQLEILELMRCFRLKQIEISNEKLENFLFPNCSELVEVKVDTPKLLSFMYDGYLVSLGLMNSSFILNATLSFKSRSSDPNPGAEWFIKLRELLSYFGHCKTLTLVCNSGKVLIFPQELREGMMRPLCDLKLLKIEIISSPRESHAPEKVADNLRWLCTDLVDSVLWLSPLLNTLSITSKSKHKTIKFVKEKLRVKTLVTNLYRLTHVGDRGKGDLLDDNREYDLHDDENWVTRYFLRLSSSLPGRPSLTTEFADDVSHTVTFVG
ncbi:hypothetical protein RJ640_027918 [Escallonia rubra]|uniref:F-box domain-containing protein n=1 Tax=Escallonia rubra TaxID=112253 RepID=A0AA88RR95_9ASTE|nr:hypothetical protein RJ640_027918 [Escallonia rubra]